MAVLRKNVKVVWENEGSAKIFCCNICEKQFCRKGSLTLHLNSHHNPKISDHDEFQLHSEKDMETACSICHKRFTAKKNLLKHLRDVHKNFEEADRMMVKKIKCPQANCNFICRMMKELRNHIESIHKIKILKDRLEFPNESVFLKWKKEEEANTVSWFVTGRQKTTLSNGTKKQILYCHRTGHYSPKGFGKYRMRSVGSCKIGVNCPASMEVIESLEGHLSVVYYKTHLGHVQDVVYLKLSREERTNLADKIEQGFTFDSIIEDVKESLDKNNFKTKRIHLLKKKDLYSIKRSAQGCNYQDKKMNKKGLIVKGKVNDLFEETADDRKQMNDNLMPGSLMEEEFNNGGIQQQNFTLYPGEGVILPQDFPLANATNIIPKDSETVNLSQSPGERISSQIVILSRDADCTSVAEIILLAPPNAVLPICRPSSENYMLSGLEDANENRSDDVVAESKRTLKKSTIKSRLEKKLQQINALLPRTEFLTPKQFALIETKLDAVLSIFMAVDAKAKFKIDAKKKAASASTIPKKKGKL